MQVNIPNIFKLYKVVYPNNLGQVAYVAKVNIIKLTNQAIIYLIGVFIFIELKKFISATNLGVTMSLQEV